MIRVAPFSQARPIGGRLPVGRDDRVQSLGPASSGRASWSGSTPARRPTLLRNGRRAVYGVQTLFSSFRRCEVDTWCDEENCTRCNGSWALEWGIPDRMEILYGFQERLNSPLSPIPYVQLQGPSSGLSTFLGLDLAPGLNSTPPETRPVGRFGMVRWSLSEATATLGNCYTCW